MTNEFVSLKQLSDELGLDRSNIRKYVLKQGLKPHKRRTPDSAHQLTLALTAEEADYIRNKREEEGFLGESKPVSKESGFFYIIQLVPELDPRRIKLGFADDVSSRLGQHRTVAPTAILIKSWPCKRSWESAAIDCLAGDSSCRLIINEVFECDDIDALLQKADQFFTLLPAPNSSPLLSEHSPYNT